MRYEIKKFLLKKGGDFFVNFAKLVIIETSLGNFNLNTKLYFNSKEYEQIIKMRFRPIKLVYNLII